MVDTERHDARRAWAAVIVAAAVGTLNYVDCFLLAVLAEPIKAELALSDTTIASSTVSVSYSFTRRWGSSSRGSPIAEPSASW